MIGSSVCVQTEEPNLAQQALPEAMSSQMDQLRLDCAIPSGGLLQNCYY